MKPFAKVHKPEDREFSQLQTNVETALKPVLGCELLDGHRLSDVVLSASAPNFVSHTLGRAYRGFFVLTPNDFNHIKLSSTTNNQLDKYIILETQSNVIVSIWVF